LICLLMLFAHTFSLAEVGDGTTKAKNAARSKGHDGIRLGVKFPGIFKLCGSNDTRMASHGSGPDHRRVSSLVRSFNPMALPTKAAMIQTQPDRLPEARAEKYRTQIQRVRAAGSSDILTQGGARRLGTGVTAFSANAPVQIARLSRGLVKYV
jgi:hypothetical protein